MLDLRDAIDVLGVVLTFAFEGLLAKQAGALVERFARRCCRAGRAARLRLGWSARGRSVRRDQVLVTVALTSVVTAGCAVVVKAKVTSAPSRSGVQSRADDLFTPAPDPPPVQATPSRYSPRPVASVVTAPQAIGPINTSEAQLAAVLLVESEVARDVGVDVLDPLAARHPYLLQVDVDPRPCTASSVLAREVGDDAFRVFRVTTAAGPERYVGSSATELANRTDAERLLSDVAAAARTCQYHGGRAAGFAGADRVVHLWWARGPGVQRHLLLVRVQNLVLQVVVELEASRAAGAADALARRVVVKWRARDLKVRRSSSPTAAPAPALPTRSGSATGAPAAVPSPSEEPEPEPTGTPPRPPGCAPPVCQT